MILNFLKKEQAFIMFHRYDGSDYLLPCTEKDFDYQRDSDYVTSIENEAGEFIYDEYGCLVSVNLCVIQPKFYNPVEHSEVT